MRPLHALRELDGLLTLGEISEAIRLRRVVKLLRSACHGAEQIGVCLSFAGNTVAETGFDAAGDIITAEVLDHGRPVGLLALSYPAREDTALSHDARADNEDLLHLFAARLSRAVSYRRITSPGIISETPDEPAVTPLLPMFAYAVDGTGRIVMAQRLLAPMLDVPEEWIGRRACELFGNRPGHAQRYERAMAGEAFSIHVHDRDTCLELHYVPLLDVERRPDGFLCLAVDATGKEQQDEQLRNISRFHQNIINNVHEWLVVCDTDLNTLVWNKAAERGSGYPREEVLGTGTCWNLLYPDPQVRQQLMARTRRLIAHQGSDIAYETNVRCRDNTKKTISWSVHTLVDENNRQTGCVFLGRDVTEQKRVEAELHIKHLALEASLNAVGIADLQGRIIYCNPATLQLLGIKDNSEIIGRHIGDFSRATMRVDEILAALHHHGEWRGEGTLLRPDGTAVNVAIHANRLNDATGEPRYLIASMMDVTDRKRAEERLREHERRFREMLENVNLLAVMLDREGNVTFVNEALLETVGFSSEDLVGKQFMEKVIHPEDREELANYYRSCMNNQYVDPSRQGRLVTSEGKERIITWNNTLLRDEHGRATGVASIGEDTTERLKTSTAMRRSDAMLRAVNHAAEEFLRRGSWETSFQEAMGELAKAAETTRAYVFQNYTAPDGSLWTRRRFEWTNSNTVFPEGFKRFHEVPWEDGKLNRCAQLLANGQVISGVAHEFSPQEQEVFEDQAVRTIAMAPIFVRQKWWGVMGLDECVTERTWSEVEIDSLRVAAGILGAAIQSQTMEQELRESDRLYRLVTENASDFIWTRDLDLNYTYISPSVERLRGYTPQEVAAQDLDEVVAPSSLETALSTWDFHLERILSHRNDDFKPVVMQLELLCKDGTTIWTETRSDVLRDDEGEIIGILGVTRDVSERRAVLAALDDEKERLAVTLRSIGEGVISTDRQGRVMLLNRAAEALVGRRQEEVEGRLISEVYRVVDPATKAPCENLIIKALDDGQPAVRQDVVLSGPDGSERLIAESAAPMQDSEGKVVGAVVAFRDETQQRALQEKAQQANRLESLGILAGGIAHDFNNLLTGILGHVNLVRTAGTLDDELLKSLEEAEKAAQYARNLTRQLLTFAKGGEPVKRPLDVFRLLEDAVGINLAGTAINCTTRLPKDLWPVEGDEGQLNQVFANLIVNARQAMQANGSLTVSAENITLKKQQSLPILTPGRFVCINIEDDGVGIDPEQINHIFDPYYSTKNDGSGLGLTIAYSIISRHGGAVSVASEPGRGTTFTIHLPAADGEISPETAGSPQQAATTGRILLMDDDRFVRQAVLPMLKRLGYEAAAVKCGEEAREAFIQAQKEGSPFDAVLLDLTVRGGLGGKAALALLREIDPIVKAVACSGYSDDKILAAPREHGFCDILVKPFRLQDLDEVLRRVLSDELP